MYISHSFLREWDRAAATSVKFLKKAQKDINKLKSVESLISIKQMQEEAHDKVIG
jgi:hypothetical protein